MGLHFFHLETCKLSKLYAHLIKCSFLFPVKVNASYVCSKNPFNTQPHVSHLKFDYAQLAVILEKIRGKILNNKDIKMDNKV